MRYLVAAIVGVGCWSVHFAEAAPPSFCPAYFHPVEDGSPLTLFPVDGPDVTVPLPPGLPSYRGAIFGPEGKTIYVLSGSRTIEAFKEIQFGPLRERIVPGTSGFRAIWHVTISRPLGKIFISGQSHEKGECGTFEVDPSTGTTRKLLSGDYRDCGGGGGAVSQDGKRAIGYVDQELIVTTLETGAVQAIKGIGGIGLSEVTWSGEVTWSPDGRWITVILDHDKILLIDATDTSRRRRLGSSHRGFVVWSPDSKYLLLEKSQLRCALAFGFFESLEVLEVATGKRTLVKSSRCNVGVGSIGWVDPQVVR